VLLLFVLLSIGYAKGVTRGTAAQLDNIEARMPLYETSATANAKLSTARSTTQVIYRICLHYKMRFACNMFIFHDRMCVSLLTITSMHACSSTVSQQLSEMTSMFTKTINDARQKLADDNAQKLRDLLAAFQTDLTLQTNARKDLDTANKNFVSSVGHNPYRACMH
jgi:hypothetical protein